jgi:hypothetical protein
MYPLWRGRSEPKVGRGRDSSRGRGWGRVLGSGEAETSSRGEAYGRARRSFLLRPRLNLLLSALPEWLAQQSERGERRCIPVRLVSERAKWLRSFRPCRLRRACQDKVSGDPRIECAYYTVGWWGDLAKVAYRRSLPKLGLGRAEGAPTAWGGPRARPEFVRDYCSRLRPGSGEARLRPLVDEALTWTVPISLHSLCWGWLPAMFRSVGGTPNYGTRQ